MLHVNFVLFFCCMLMPREARGSDNSDHPSPFAYEEVYERLYAGQGYHSDLRLYHGGNIGNFLDNPIWRKELGPILDAGCSHGAGVNMLWNAGFQASGVDVSRTAVKLAIQARKGRGDHHKLCAERPCFRQGSLTQIPWANGTFDAVISSDVMEHITPTDVPYVIREFRRIGARWLFLKIANKPEVNKEPVHFLSQQNLTILNLVTTLHSTVKPLDWWKARFAKEGYHHLLGDMSFSVYHCDYKDGIPR